MKTWQLNDETLKQLSPEGWYIVVFTRESVVRFLSPVVVDAMAKQLCRNFHLYSFNLHIVGLPLFITSRWRKQLITISMLQWLGEPQYQLRLLVSISPSVLSVPSEHTPSDIYLYNQIMILVSRITKLSILMKEVRFISLYILEIVHKKRK